MRIKLTLGCRQRGQSQRRRRFETFADRRAQAVRCLFFFQPRSEGGQGEAVTNRTRAKRIHINSVTEQTEERGAAARGSLGIRSMPAQPVFTPARSKGGYQERGARAAGVVFRSWHLILRRCYLPDRLLCFGTGHLRASCMQASSAELRSM